MVDDITWRENCIASLNEMLEGGMQKIDFVKALARESNEDSGRPSRQAVYKWFRTGSIADTHLEAVARFTQSDPAHFKLTGELRPEVPATPTAHNKIAFEIYTKLLRLPESAQRTALQVVDEMTALQTWHRRDDHDPSTPKKGQRASK